MALLDSAIDHISSQPKKKLWRLAWARSQNRRPQALASNLPAARAGACGGATPRDGVSCSAAHPDALDTAAATRQARRVRPRSSPRPSRKHSAHSRRAAITKPRRSRTPSSRSAVRPRRAREKCRRANSDDDGADAANTINPRRPAPFDKLGAQGRRRGVCHLRGQRRPRRRPSRGHVVRPRVAPGRHRRQNPALRARPRRRAHRVHGRHLRCAKAPASTTPATQENSARPSPPSDARRRRSIAEKAAERLRPVEALGYVEAPQAFWPALNTESREPLRPPGQKLRTMSRRAARGRDPDQTYRFRSIASARACVR